MINVNECLFDITFTNHRHDTNKLRVFNITRLLPLIKQCLGCEVVIIDLPLHAEARKMFENDWGVEPHRLARLKEPFDPVISVLNEPEPTDPPNVTSMTVIDGGHRVVKSYELGRKSLKSYVVPPTVWRKVLVDLSPWGIDMDNPTPHQLKVLLGGFSGIL